MREINIFVQPCIVEYCWILANTDKYCGILVNIDDISWILVNISKYSWIWPILLNPNIGENWWILLNAEKICEYWIIREYSWTFVDICEYSWLIMNMTNIGEFLWGRVLCPTQWWGRAGLGWVRIYYYWLRKIRLPINSKCFPITKIVNLCPRLGSDQEMSKKCFRYATDISKICSKTCLKIFPNWPKIYSKHAHNILQRFTEDIL